MTHAELFTLTKDLAESRAELVEVHRISVLELARLDGEITDVEQRIEDARLAGEREIAELREQIDEVVARLAVAQDKLVAAQSRFNAARAAS
jgi:hypothetical protein